MGRFCCYGYAGLYRYIQAWYWLHTVKNEPPGSYKANPVGYYKKKNQDKGHFRVLFEDDFEEVLKEMQRVDFAILNGISYFGRRNLQAHASKMFAMIFDLDGVTDESLNSFLVEQ